MHLVNRHLSQHASAKATARRRHRAARTVLLVTAALVATWWLLPSSPEPSATAAMPTPSAVSPVLHWRGNGQHWLLVTDRTRHELVIYDANDGRPLRRLGQAQGLGQVMSVRTRGNRLVVDTGSPTATRVLSLPGLQPSVLAAR